MLAYGRPYFSLYCIVLRRNRNSNGGGQVCPVNLCSREERERSTVGPQRGRQEDIVTVGRVMRRSLGLNIT